MNKSINDNFSNISKDDKLWNEPVESAAINLSNNLHQNNDNNLI